MAMTYNWKDKKILVVEDVEINSIYYEAAFRHTHADVSFVKNGEDAVAFIEKNGRVDAILMDIYMPIMDGYEATSIIKKKWKDIPVIMQTAYFLNGEEELSYQVGCDEFIAKPIPKAKLLSIVDLFLRNQQGVSLQDN